MKIPAKIAVVIPFNPHLDFSSGSVTGSLIAHKLFADEHGAVFWDLVNACPHNEVKTAYFYDPKEKAVTFKSRVDLFDEKENIEKTEEEFLPNWRKEDWESCVEGDRVVWLKLGDIYPLKRKYSLSEFKKLDGERLGVVRNYALVVDGELEAKIEKITVDQVIDDHLYRLLTQENEKLQEKDIEEMLWNLMLKKNFEYIDRQKNGRDVTFKDSKGGLIVIEIKKGTANIGTLDQIKRYMKEIMTRHSAAKVSGIILCKKADIELQEAVMNDNERNVVIDEYKLSISFPKIEARDYYDST